MKTLKVKGILFSLMTFLAIAVMMTSCGQTEVIEPIVERAALQEAAHDYTALESTETYRLMSAETDGLDMRNSCYLTAENLYIQSANQYAANPTNYNLYLRNHYYIAYLTTYVHCCTNPNCGPLLDLAYDAYVQQYTSDGIHNPPCDYAQLIWEMYDQLHAVCSC